MSKPSKHVTSVDMLFDGNALLYTIMEGRFKARMNKSSKIVTNGGSPHFFTVYQRNDTITDGYDFPIEFTKQVQLPNVKHGLVDLE